MARRRTAAVVQSVSEWWTKWLHRSGAFALWAIFASFLFFDQGVVGIALDRFWADGKAAWEPQVLAIFVAILLIVGWVVGTKRAALAALYVLFFPIVALGIIASKAFGTASVVAVAIRTVGSFSLSGANWILLFVACVVLDRTSAAWIMIASTVFLFISVVYVVLSNFYWVTTPFNSVLRFAQWAQKTAWGSVSKHQKELLILVPKVAGSKAADRDRLRDEILKKAQAVADQAKYALVVAGRTKLVSGGKIVLFYVFAARFILALAAVVLGFAGIYRGLDKLLPGSFSGHGINSLWYAFYYSVTTFFTVGDGTVAPASTLAQVAVVAQVIFAVLTLTVLALSFSTLSVDIATENASAVERVARAHYESCMQVLERRCGVTAPMPLDAMEQLKSDFDKHIRRAKRIRKKEDDQVKLAGNVSERNDGIDEDESTALVSTDVQSESPQVVDVQKVERKEGS